MLNLSCQSSLVVFVVFLAFNTKKLFLSFANNAMNEPINEHFDRMTKSQPMNELENANTDSGWVQFRVAILTAKFLVSGRFVKPLAVKNARRSVQRLMVNNEP